MTTFKKGDRVIGIGTVDGRSIDGIAGTIHGPFIDGPSMVVEFDSPFEGHNLYGTKNGRGWVVRPSALKPAPKVTVTDTLGGPFTGPYRTREIVKTWIVAVLDAKGKPRPADQPATYVSEAQANRVAQEMAAKAPGEAFMVFVSTAVSAVPQFSAPELVKL